MRKRNRAITIRLSEEEFAQLENRVQESGQTQQHFIIDACLKGQITSADEITEMRNKNKLLADIDKQLDGTHLLHGEHRLAAVEITVVIVTSRNDTCDRAKQRSVLLEIGIRCLAHLK